jgi:hypothetical protein
MSRLPEGNDWRVSAAPSLYTEIIDDGFKMPLAEQVLRAGQELDLQYELGFRLGFPQPSRE